MRRKKRPATYLPRLLWNVLFQAHPALWQHPDCLAFLGAYLTSSWLDKRGGIVIAAGFLRKLLGIRGGAAVVKLQEELRACGISMLVWEANRFEGRARGAKLLFDATVEQVIAQHREGDLLFDAQVNLETGKEQTERDRRRTAHQLWAEGRAEAEAVADPDQRARLLAYYDDRSCGLARAIKRNLPAAVEEARQIENKEARWSALRLLHQLQVCPRFLPHPSRAGKSPRIYGSPLQLLPTAIRAVLTPQHFELDLSAIQLTILPTMVKAPEASTTLEVCAREEISPWDGVVDPILEDAPSADPERVRGAVKALVYSGVCGATAQEVAQWAESKLGPLGVRSPGAKILRNPVVGELLAVRDELASLIMVSGYADIGQGRRIDVPFLCEDAGERRSRVASAIACALQREEQKVMDEVRRVVVDCGFKCDVDLFDSVAVRAPDLRSKKKVEKGLQEIRARVRSFLEARGISSWLKVDRDPRDDFDTDRAFRKTEAGVAKLLGRTA